MTEHEEKNADSDSPLDRLVMQDELRVMIKYHKNQADYHRDCSATQKELADRRPLYTFGEMQTRADWLNASGQHEAMRQYHRQRARYWHKHLSA